MPTQITKTSLMNHRTSSKLSVAPLTPLTPAPVCTQNYKSLGALKNCQETTPDFSEVLHSPVHCVPSSPTHCLCGIPLVLGNSRGAKKKFVFTNYTWFSNSGSAPDVISKLLGAFKSLGKSQSYRLYRFYLVYLQMIKKIKISPLYIRWKK